MTSRPDQQHPQAERDRAILERIAQEGQTDYNLVEVARLRIRYQDFPGAREVQRQLAQILQTWGLSEADLFERSRAIHATAQVYRQRHRGDQQDWS